MKTLLTLLLALSTVSAFAAPDPDPAGKLARADVTLNEIWNELPKALRQELRSSEIAFIHQRDAITDLDEKLTLTEQRIDYLLSLQSMPRIRW